jgi:hypothetical protein
MKRINVLLLAFFVFSCVSVKEQNKDTASTEQLNFSVTIHNNTIWDISILSENKDRMILKGKIENVSLPIQKNELSLPYEIICYVKITSDVIKPITLVKKVIKKDEKSVNIDQKTFECDESYFVLTNTADSIIKVIRPDSNTYRAGIGPDTESSNSIFELRRGQSNVYKPENLSCSVENENKVLFPIPQKIRKGWVDSFIFDGSSVILTDSRPLHRVGESAWVKPNEDSKELENVTSVMPLVTEDNIIHFFVSTEKELTRIVYDSTGIDNNTKSIPSRDSFNITYLSAVNDGFFIAGYKKINNDKYKPYVRVLDVDGVIRRELPDSVYKSIRLYTAAQKDNTWLIAGDGIGDYDTHTAYVRIFKDEGNKLIDIKEFKSNEFPRYNGMSQCEDIMAAVYNNKKDCWLISGNIQNESFNGSYLARINNDYTIQIINKFKEIYFYKILADEKNSDYYLAGQEKNGNETFAVLFKYNADDKQIWQLRDHDQPLSHSFYNDAIFDARNKKDNTNNEDALIILAGTLQAKEEYGNGGIPFIEAINITNGKRIWQEKLTDSEFDGTSLVTAIALAPYYGYVLTLSGGIEEGYFNRQPFRIARLNSFGKRFNYTY